MITDTVAETKAASPVGTQPPTEAVNLPVAETKAASPVGTQLPAKPSLQAVPKSSRRKVAWQITGIVFAMLAGFLSNRFWGWDIFYPGSDSFFILLGIGIFVLVCIGASLLRTWWALLIVPVAWLVGEFLGSTLIPLTLSTWTALQDAFKTWHFQWSLSLLILLVSLVIGTFIGTVFEGRFKKQQQP